MINHKQFFLLVFSLVALTSCCYAQDKSKNIDYTEVLKNNLKAKPLDFIQTDTLTLTAKYCECGEFGGHIEKIKVFKNYKNEYFVKYTRDSIDKKCPNDFREKAVIIKDTLFKIDIDKQEQIVKYLDELYKKTISNNSLYSSNEYFDASTTHKKLNLFTAEHNTGWNEFRKLQLVLVK